MGYNRFSNRPWPRGRGEEPMGEGIMAEKMIDLARIDYQALDSPQVLSVLFYPRAASGLAGRGLDLMIPVTEDIKISARFHPLNDEAATILFFHGNGEIAEDYDDLAPYFNQAGANFLAVDYRGYGLSGGRPTVTSMMRDCHKIFFFVRKWLADRNYRGPLLIMGRSLGSASALELAGHYGELIPGLIVESGFARADLLLALLGADPAGMNRRGAAFDHLEKIRSYTGPTLIIHAEYDHIIPFSDGQALFEACGAVNKTFLKIPGANHNDIQMRGLAEYLAAISDLVQLVGAGQAT